VEPAVLHDSLRRLLVFVVAEHHAGSLCDKLPDSLLVHVVKPHLCSWDRTSDVSGSGIEIRLNRYDRRRFGQPVSDIYFNTETRIIPGCLRIKRRRAADNEAEPSAERLVYHTEDLPLCLFSGHVGKRSLERKDEPAAPHLAVLSDYGVPEGVQKQRHRRHDGRTEELQIRLKPPQRAVVCNAPAVVDHKEESCSTFKRMVERRYRQSAVVGCDLQHPCHPHDVRADVVLRQHDTL